LIKTDYEKRETAAILSWPPPAGHPTLPLSPWYFEEKNSKEIIEIDEKTLKKNGLY
jgi:hypothetical protein